ncbi:MAG: outer membrane protein TolC [Cyclobacteriaceae bacterium]
MVLRQQEKPLLKTPFNHLDMNKIFAFICFIIVSNQLFAQENKLTLFDVIDLAKENSIASKAADTRKENRYWQYRSFKANYNPSLNLSGNLPGYNRDYFANRLDDGSIIYQSRKQVSSSLNLGLIQPIAATGATVSVNSRLNQFGNFASSTLDDEYRSTVLNISLDQPIFGFNDLKWDKLIEPLRYEESKRTYVEEMELISQQATMRYFNYLDAQINLQIAKFNLANNETNYKIQEGRYNIGTVSKDQLLQVELQLLSSQRAVIQANLDLQTARLALMSYIGLRQDTDLAIELVEPEELPVFQIPVDEALIYAQQNRSDFIQFERRRVEANRDVAQAKSQRFQTNLSASFGYNQAGSNLNDAYNNPNDEQAVNVSLSMPILDWGRSRARYETARANQQLTEYALDQEGQNFEQEIITLVGRFEVLRANVIISKRSDEVAAERYNVTQNRYLIDKSTITDLNIAQTQKDEAKRAYLNSLRQFWDAYFQLRRLTLYDFLNQDLLYVEEN